MAISQPMMVKRQQVRALLETGQYTQKEIARMVGVSEKTLSHWVTAHNWKAPSEAMLNSPVLLTAFSRFVCKCHPSLHRQLQAALTEFLLTPNAEKL